MKRLNYTLPFAFSALLVIGMLLGYQVRENTESKRPFKLGADDKNRLDEVMRLIELSYVDEVNHEDLVDQAIEGIVDGLDPHSYLISREELAEVNEELQGKFEGIGIEFYIVEDTILVVSPISGGPSEALGIRSGDKIIEIEDENVAGIGITNKDVVDRLRGEKGSEVTIGIMRNGESELLEYEIVRDKIPIVSVDVGYMVDDEVGYIKVNRFSATTNKEFLTELRKLKLEGMKSLMLDLRGNPGGYLTAATMIADELIEGRGVLCYTKGQSRKRTDYNAKAVGEFEDGELIVLIDEGSASASEILAGAIQDYDRGIIVGRRSFGKGLVQEQEQLSDGSAIRLTVARYYTPSGRSIQKPFGKDNDAYRNEVNNRYENGELLNKDSIHTEDLEIYTTLNQGRKVLGGGGILPDLFIPLDTSGDIALFNRVRSYIPRFVYDYYSDNTASFEAYKASDLFRDRFFITEPLFQQFVEYAHQEGLKATETDIESIQADLKTVMKAYFGRQIWGDESFYAIINPLDNTFNKAYATLKSDVTLQSLLFLEDSDQ